MVYNINGGSLGISETYEYAENNVYGTSDRINEYTVSVGDNTSNYVYTYNGDGNIVKIDYGNGVEVTYTYDPLGRLASENNDLTGKYYTYTYDDAGNITKVTLGLQPDEDDDGFIQMGVIGEGAELDAFTPVLPIIPPTRTYTYTDSDWGDLLTNFSGTDITYDEIGNPLSYYNGYSYTFTWRGRQLLSATKGTKNMSFVYNEAGLRIAKTVNGSTTHYVYEGELLVAEYTDTLTIIYIYDVNGVAVGFKCRKNTYSPDTWDVYFYEKNLQGDIVAIYDATGTKLVSYVYTAWGTISKTHHNGGGSTTAINNNLTYRGYYYDSDLAMYYLQTRYYDPAICRFINADDQISGVGGELLGYNMFVYCMNNPVNMSDSTGNWPSWSNLLKGSTWLVVGISAVCVGVSVLTCGVATPVIMAVVGVTVGAGALTTVSGASEIGEAFTGYNIVRDTVFSGNQKAYNAYAYITAAVAEVGTAVCGGWLTKNSPRINTYNSMDSYNVKNKHLSSASGDWSKFNTTSQTELRALGKEVLKNTPMSFLVPNSADSYTAIYNFGRVIGTSGQTSARLVFSAAGKIITFFPQ